MICDVNLQEASPAAPTAYVQEGVKPNTSPVLAAVLQELQLCAAPLLAIPDGPKTVPMIQELNEGSLVHYDAEKQTLHHQGVSFQVLKGSNASISQGPVVSIGSNTLGREIISLDPNNSPLLESKYQELLALLKDPQTGPRPLANTLEFIADYVREEIFSPSRCSEKALEYFVRRWQKDKARAFEDFALTKENTLIAVMPIDLFIEHKIGICRHQALVTAYLLDRLSKEESILPPGNAYHVRDIVEVGSVSGGHAWNLYVLKEPLQGWHVDALWGVVKNSADPGDLEYLQLAYGKGAISREIVRFVSMPY